LSDFAFVIKTLLRPQCLGPLLQSLRTYYPDTPVYVADDSPEPYPEVAASFQVAYRTFDEDAGIGYCLNRIVQDMAEPVAVLLDDDFLLTPQTQIERLVGPVLSGECEVCGGALRRTGSNSLHQFIGHFTGAQGERLQQFTPEVLEAMTEPVRVDATVNFYAARVDMLREVRYNEELKVARHLDFFRRLYVRDTYPEAGTYADAWRQAWARRQGATRILYHPGCVIYHGRPDRPPVYRKHRFGRILEYRTKYMDLWGFEDRPNLPT